jgi:hypothetical protein
MYYVYSCTYGDSQKHLYPRYQPEADDPFHTAKEMIKYLGSILQNPYRSREARYEYQQLTMGKLEPFHEFKTRFLHLADEAKIPRSERFDDLLDKLSLPLQAQLAGLCHTLDRDFEGLYTLVI